MKKHEKTLLTFVILTVAVSFFGCGGKTPPEGFPKLYSAQVTITQENTPLAGATVTLLSEDTSMKYLVSGITDEKGVAKLVTHGEYPGAPEGKYKLCVSKIIHDDDVPVPSDPGEIPAWREKMKNDPPKTHTYVEEQYGSARTTPLRVEITSGSNKDFTFDLGKAIHIETSRTVGL